MCLIYFLHPTVSVLYCIFFFLRAKDVNNLKNTVFFILGAICLDNDVPF